MTRYRCTSEWEVDASIDRTWDALLDVGKWPSWWRGFRAVERLAGGEPSGVGMRIRQHWRSLLPYTVVLDLEMTRVERHRLLEGRATGDMAGTCTWSFEDLGGRTRVRFELDVRPTRWWMRLPVPFAGRIFAWNVGAIMGWGSEGLAGLLGTTVVDRTADTGGRRSHRAGLAGA
jgi:hypothetical protein